MDYLPKQERCGAVVMSTTTASKHCHFSTHHQASSSHANKRSLTRSGYAWLFGISFLGSTLCNFQINFRAVTTRLINERDDSVAIARRELLESKKMDHDLRHPKPLLKKTVDKHQSPRLDFLIAGFPKCGTTTLLYAFAAHNETSISNREKCSMSSENLTDRAATLKLDQDINELDPSPAVKRGIKCPSGIKNSRALERLSSHSPDARIVIGVRHPVLYFQSYYNYRVTEIHNRKLKDKIPPIEELVETEWKGVSTDSARFELFLMQMGKANLTTSNMDALVGRANMGIKPNPFSIFIYSVEQLEDNNEARAKKFRNDMQNFLGLQNPIPPFGHENLNHFVGEQSLEQTIDICNVRYDRLRALLVRQGEATQEWIRNDFLSSPDVFVGGDEQHFLSLLDTWSKDPCKSKSSSSALHKKLVPTTAIFTT